METFSHPALRIERVNLTPAMQPYLKDSIKIQPNLYLKINSPNKQIQKIYLDLIFNQYLDQIQESPLIDIFKQWDEEAMQIVEQVQEKWGVDVALLGSNNPLKQHICKFCGAVFSKATALGGHTSKMHSSLSKKDKKQAAEDKKDDKKSETSPKKKTIKKKNCSSKKVIDSSNLDVIFEDSENESEQK